MAHAEILIPKKNWKPREIVKSQEAPGKPKRMMAGSWIHDLCASRKVICLCSFCTHKFNPGRLGYIKEKNFPVVQAKCDGCSAFDQRCIAYFWEETYYQVRSTPEERRRNREKSVKSLKKEGHL
jgi:hypothetical protein